MILCFDYFLHLRGIILYSKNFALSCTTPFELLTPCWFLEKKLKSQFKENFWTRRTNLIYRRH